MHTGKKTCPPFHLIFSLMLMYLFRHSRLLLFFSPILEQDICFHNFFCFSPFLQQFFRTTCSFHATTQKKYRIQKGYGTAKQHTNDSVVFKNMSNIWHTHTWFTGVQLHDISYIQLRPIRTHGKALMIGLIKFLKCLVFQCQPDLRHQLVVKI